MPAAANYHKPVGLRHQKFMFSQYFMFSQSLIHWCQQGHAPAKGCGSNLFLTSSRFWWLLVSSSLWLHHFFSTLMGIFYKDNFHLIEGLPE
jgi:hypothetical protein